VIGVCMSGRHTLATKVHSYRAANNPEALERAVRDVFAEVGAKTDTGAPAASVFREISGIPSEVAAAAIGALASGAADKSAVPAGAADNTSPSAGTPQPSGWAPGAGPRPPESGGPWLWVIVVVIIMFVVFIFSAKAGMRQRTGGQHRKPSR